MQWDRCHRLTRCTVGSDVLACTWCQLQDMDPACLNPALGLASATVSASSSCCVRVVQGCVNGCASVHSIGKACSATTTKPEIRACLHLNCSAIVCTHANGLHQASPAHWTTTAVAHHTGLAKSSASGHPIKGEEGGLVCVCDPFNSHTIQSLVGCFYPGVHTLPLFDLAAAKPWRLREGRREVRRRVEGPR